MKRLCCFLILGFALIFDLYSQHYTFSNYSINKGLSQSVVNCVFQDSKGYIWLGTQNGLDRFDGREFKLFRFNPADSNSISNNWIYAISEDRENNLWIGTKGGLHKYFRKENRFERIEYETGYSFDVTNYSYDNLCLKNGNILVNTPPVISILDLKENTFSHFTSNLEYDASVKDVKIPVLEDNDGDIWVGSSNGLAKFSVKMKKFEEAIFHPTGGGLLRRANVTALFQDKAEAIWVGASGKLYRKQKNDIGFDEVCFQQESGEVFNCNFLVRSITQDKKGDLIIATEGDGIFFISETGDGEFNIQNLNLNNSGIGHNIVQCLLIDKSENLWAGTLSGISKTDLKPKKFRLFQNNNLPNSTNLLGNVMAALFKNDDGIIWAGNWGQGLNLVNPATNEVEHFSSQHSGNHFLPNDFVHVILKDNEKNIWLGTRNGIFIYDKPYRRFVLWNDFFQNPNLPTFENTRIYHIIQDREQNFWIASSNGLFKVDLPEVSVEIFHTNAPPSHRLSANLIYSIFEDSDGLIWIATINGLEVYNPKSGEIKHFTKELHGLSSNFLISLCEDAEGRIWIGSNAYINIFDKKTSEFSYLGQEDGLPSNYIYEIQKDKNNNLWLATGNGLCKLNHQTGRVVTYALEDGLQSPEFNLRASCVCENGELLFGGMNGFNLFYPDSITGNPNVPDLAFTAFTKTSNDVEEAVNLSGTDKLVLNHKVQSFTIKFAALEFTNPENNTYAYKMKGVSDGWVKIGNRNFVPFFALPPGEYEFSVKGSNNDEIWNKEGISLRIVILPPWWRSVYAYFAYLVLIALGIWVFIKLRERRLKLDKIRLEKKVLERTIQIKEQNRVITAKNDELNELNRTKDKFFSIIGHDLRNHFNIIIGFSESLLSGFQNMDQLKKEQHITNIYKSSVHAHDLLGNLLTWARLQRNAIVFQPEKINVAARIRKLIRFHEEAALKKNILIEVFAKEEIEVNADINMFESVVRNLVANAIKFTERDGEISIHLKRADGFCEIEVKDSGIGIPEENMDKIFRIDSNITTRGTCGEKGTGLGLVLCKEFVEKHGGKIWVESEVGGGSEFMFSLPLN